MERFTGCLLGLAVGDALGTPLEGLKDGHIFQVYGEVTDYVDSVAGFPDRPAKWQLKGLYSSDTQQALAVADVLAIHGALELSALAELYQRLVDEGGAENRECGAHRGVNHFFRRALATVREASAAGGDLRHCGQPTPDNGAVARAIPLGLFFADDEEALSRAVIDASLLTHSDPRAVAAPLAVARVVGWMVRGELEPSEIAQRLPRYVLEWETRLGDEYGEFLDPSSGHDRLHHFSKALAPLASLLREDNPTLTAKTIINEANAFDPPSHIAQPHDTFAPASVVMALYRALSARSFHEALGATINAGGDADTVGAITGGILGLRFGEGAIPPAWLRGLVNAEQVRRRGIALFQREVDWAHWEDYVEMEKDLTRRQIEFEAHAMSEHRRQVEKREAKQAQRRAQGAKTAAAKPATADLGFAPPPEVWLGKVRDNRDAGGADLDPIQAKKEKALRGRKRIGWKEDRRRGKKGSENESDE